MLVCKEWKMGCMFWCNMALHCNTTSNNNDINCYSNSGSITCMQWRLIPCFSLLQFNFSYLVSSVAMKKPSSEASSQFCLCLLITGMVLVLMALALACKALPLVIWVIWGAACWNYKKKKKEKKDICLRTSTILLTDSALKGRLYTLLFSKNICSSSTSTCWTDYTFWWSVHFDVF